ncbi:MAG: 3'-5' exonuclease [Treponema sp.]|jgi:DNA polymerase-3 subunit epsilon|nr:3'-5' exonuclease [Treponema sp.]
MDFVTIDFETGQYARESACAVGLAKYRQGKLVDSFYSLVRPPVLYIRPDFTEIHGLTVEDVQYAPGFDALWEARIQPFMAGFPVAAHNAPFDMGVLRAVLRWYELSLPRFSYFCTLALSRHTWPELASHKLSFLGSTFGITYAAHNALADAQVCGDIVCRAAKHWGSGKLQELLQAARIGLSVFSC